MTDILDSNGKPLTGLALPSREDMARLSKGREVDHGEFDYDSINKEVWPDPIAERARLWKVPPNAFKVLPAFNRVFVYQIMTWDLDEEADGTWKLKGSSIALPQNIVDIAKKGAPRGILLSAGAQAYDRLLTNDIRLGDYVRFVKLAPYMMPVDLDKNMNVHHIIPMDDAAIVGSEDKADRLASGATKRVWVNNKDFRGFAYRGAGLPDDAFPQASTSYEDM